MKPQGFIAPVVGSRYVEYGDVVKSLGYVPPAFVSMKPNVTVAAST